MAFASPSEDSFSVRVLHSKADRFVPHPKVARTLKLRNELRERLRAASASLFSIDALFYERLVERAVDGQPGGDGAWCPSLVEAERIVDALEQQCKLATLIEKKISARTTIIKALMKTCCFNNLSRVKRQSIFDRTSSKIDGLKAPDAETVLIKQSSRRSISIAALIGDGAGTTTSCECSDASHIRIARLLEQLDDATDEVTVAIIVWRLNLSRPLPFFVDGNNYLLLIFDDAETLIVEATSHLVEQAGGHSLFNAKSCPFFYMSRYLGSGRRRDHTSRLSNVDNDLRFKTILAVINRELSTQEQLVDEIESAASSGVHLLPLCPCFYRVPLYIGEDGGEQLEMTIPDFVVESKADWARIRAFIDDHYPRMYPKQMRVMLKATSLPVYLVQPATTSMSSDCRSSGTAGKMPLAPLKHRKVLEELPKESQYVTVDVVDERNRITSAGMYYIMQRMLQQDPLVVSKSLRWIELCCQHARNILQEPFGSVVQGVRKAAAAKKQRDAQVCHSLQVMLQPVSSLDALVRQIYGDSAFAQYPQEHGRVDVLERSMGSSMKVSSVLALQRQSVRRFGIRIFRRWLRSTMRRMQRHEVILEMKEQNERDHLSARFASWREFRHMRVQQRKAAKLYRRVSLLQHLRKRYNKWKTFVLQKQIAKQLHNALVGGFYRRWISFFAFRKALKFQGNKADYHFLKAVGFMGKILGQPKPSLRSVADLTMKKLML